MTDDPTMRRLQKIILDRLKNDKNPVIAEMAKEIAAGRLTPRDALSIDSYAEAVFKAGRENFSKVAALPDEEREELAAQGRRALEESADQKDEAEDTDRQATRAPGAEATARRPRRPRPEPEDDEPTDSIMVGVRAERAARPSPPTEPVTHAASRSGLPRSVRDRRRG